MKKIKKIAASILAVAAMATSMVGISASAATNVYPASIYLLPKNAPVKAKLINNTSETRYSTVSFYVYKRSNGHQETAAYNNSVLGHNEYVETPAVSSDYSSSTTYYHEGIGSIFNGNIYQSGVYITVTDDDL